MLVASGLKKAFLGDPLFSGVNLSIEDGRCVGLVGPNGAGKSTLAKILAGRLEPDEGTVSVTRGARVVYLSQRSELTPGRTVREEARDAFADLAEMEERLRELEAAMGRLGAAPAEIEALVHRHDDLRNAFERRGGWDRERLVEQALTGLDLPEELRDRDVATLSGGQAARVSLAKALLQRPDLLILDEPTNHLDLDAVEWLEDHVRSRAGSTLVVSHDRWFLDRTTTETFVLENRRLFAYPGSFSKAWGLRDERRAREAKEYERQQETIRKEEDFIRRNIANKEFAARARSRRKKLERMERLEAPPPEGAKLSLPGAPPPEIHAAEVLVLEDVAAAVGGRRLFSGLSLRISREQCIGVVGPNGVGKSTLLRIAIGELSPAAGRVVRAAKARIGYLAQEHAAGSPGRTVLDVAMAKMPGASTGEARSYLARFLFRGEEADKDSGVLSGGEAARLSLALLFLDKPNFLVLDEPTNHLDLDAREALEDALAEFPGTVLLVSHDRYLLEKVVDRVLELRPDGALLTDGGWSDHLAARAAKKAERPAPPRPAAPSAAKAAAPTKPGRVRNPYRFERLEAEIMEKESRLSAIHADLAAEATWRDPERVKALQRELAETEERLAALNREWEEWLE